MNNHFRGMSWDAFRDYRSEFRARGGSRCEAERLARSWLEANKQGFDKLIDIAEAVDMRRESLTKMARRLGVEMPEGRRARTSQNIIPAPRKVKRKQVGENQVAAIPAPLQPRYRTLRAEMGKTHKQALQCLLAGQKAGAW